MQYGMQFEFFQVMERIREEAFSETPLSTKRCLTISRRLDGLNGPEPVRGFSPYGEVRRSGTEVNIEERPRRGT